MKRLSKKERRRIERERMQARLNEIFRKIEYKRSEEVRAELAATIAKGKEDAALDRVA